MYNLLKKLARHSAFYAAANSIEAFSPVILAIVLTRLLAPSQYGVWVLFIAVVTFLRPLVNFSIQDALKMYFFEMSQGERARFVWSAFCVSTTLAAAFVAATLLFADALSVALRFPAEWLVAIPVTAYLYAYFYFLLAYNQFAQFRRRFIALHIVQTLASLVAIFVLVYSGHGWMGIVIGKIVGLAVVCLAGSYLLLTELRFDRAVRAHVGMASLIRFGLVYVPTGLGVVAIPLTDRLIVTHVIGLAENGLYGVAALFGSAVFVAINGFLLAWMPWLFRNLGNWEQRKHVIFRVSFVFLALLPVAGIVFYLVSSLIAPVIIGGSYAASWPLIPWTIAGVVAMGYFFHNQAFLHYKKAVVAMSVNSLACIVLNAVLSYYGAIAYGVTGVLAATIFAFLVAALMSAAASVPRYRPLDAVAYGAR